MISNLLSRLGSSSGSASAVSPAGSSQGSFNKIGYMGYNPPPEELDQKPMAWGAKLSQAERLKVREIADMLAVEADWLMAVMAFESGRTFSPSVRNLAGSRAVGLIQFMPATALALGTTAEDLARMTRLEQLDYVRMYFKPYAGRMRSLGDMYMAVLWPKAVGKADGYVLWDAGQQPTAYRQNSGLDSNNDHRVEKWEATGKLMAMLAEGRKPGNLWVGGML